MYAGRLPPGKSTNLLELLKLLGEVGHALQLLDGEEAAEVLDDLPSHFHGVDADGDLPAVVGGHVDGQQQAVPEGHEAHVQHRRPLQLLAGETETGWPAKPFSKCEGKMEEEKVSVILGFAASGLRGFPLGSLTWLGGPTPPPGGGP